MGISVEELLSAESGHSIRADVLYALVNYLNIDPEEVMEYIEAHKWACFTDDDVDYLSERWHL
ncbi:MAG: hypothetical protein EOP06_00335 [Proteobacteria bacterium]|nr:MAG: hypothetical protein EOP06_00335 [Pseudomonadota bacterium]